MTVFEEVQQRRAVVPVELARPLDDVGPGERRDRHEGDRADVEATGQRVDLGHDLVEALLAVADEIHLVDRHHHVRHAEQGGEQQMAPRLIDDAVTGVDQHDGELGVRHAGDHVARVLHVPRAVGDHEVAVRRREVAVGHVDRDALLALGAQAVGQQGEVDVLVATPPADRLDVGELVLEDRLRVVEQTADQRGLAVVDAADRGEVQRRRPPVVTRRKRQIVLDHAHLRSSPAACGLPCPPRRCDRRRGLRRAR